mgnify:CR=1 FL=1
MLVTELYAFNLICENLLAALCGVALYMSAPPSFGMQSYIETKEPGKFVAAANSLYMIITLGVYVFITAAYVK